VPTPDVRKLVRSTPAQAAGNRRRSEETARSSSSVAPVRRFATERRACLRGKRPLRRVGNAFGRLRGVCGRAREIRVLSNLGQPLRAEIDLTSAGEDADSMSVRLASPDAFSKANIDYSASLSTLRFTLDRRANGQPFIHVTSTRPINDPFVDMLLELNWSSGRSCANIRFCWIRPTCGRRASHRHSDRRDG